MQLTFESKYNGKKPPLIKPTASSGVKGDFNLNNYMGKWVLLSFLGLKSDCNHVASLRNQINLFNTDKSVQDRLQIIVILEAEVKDFQTFEETLLPALNVCKSLKEFPFPVIIDTTGNANEDYEVGECHRSFLINPEGNLVVYGQDGLVLPEEIRDAINGIPKGIIHVPLSN
jgi:hypothetical protein